MKEKRVLVCLTNEEKDLLYTAAKASGYVGVSTYMRVCALKQAKYDKKIE